MHEKSGVTLLQKENKELHDQDISNLDLLILLNDRAINGYQGKLRFLKKKHL